jgi:hypothetical protein
VHAQAWAGLEDQLERRPADTNDLERSTREGESPVVAGG